ncbi:RNB domain-containing ribonuclease [Corynebacterium pseudotuberculosis]|uniref:RNB domain-containing ribonuclease n=1 Tax=Corynebacterium pseudotuberculosis TaxID=1719 RepID=UPI0004D49E2B|nr:RNB domain-containing ribonuclease [Corynebacterium pseudotuberculosis]AKS13815.1 Exoribonuclease [Corynebacterium pseudotuberculosis]KEX88021.1 3'-to-5' exoribonuclease RNase R [Corynebacterium pseudotuberculosis]UTO23907.1 RNB domain-containing ribonuclease [Corynebacterium pseudotuberculosis]VTQ77696.1 Ribonuclease R [Corynebacterium pseudotuberculosis]
MKLYAAFLDFGAIADEFGVTTRFPKEVEDQALQLVDALPDRRTDRRDIELVTVDPPGSQDLDQAICIEKTPEGFRVFYAIADVAAFLNYGEHNLVAQESLRRGQTIYLPDEPARLHPAVLSEEAASLLPKAERPAVLWTIDIDPAGEVIDFRIDRALICSRARFDYKQVQQDHADGSLHPSLLYLFEVGRLRRGSKLRSTAINLRIPSQSVEKEPDGEMHLVIEPRYESMDANSEISLLAGMCAGNLMAQHGVGVLRALAPAKKSALEAFAQEATVLGFPADIDLDSISLEEPRSMVLMRAAQKLLRGAEYRVLGEDTAEVHAGVGGYYSHVTAPLRRLIDRYATEICLSLYHDQPIPAWVTETLPEAVAAMKHSSATASAVDKACLDLTEATVLSPWVGHNFKAVVLSNNEAGASSRIFVEDPPVIAECLGLPAVGEQTTVTLISTDVEKREIRFAWPAD